MIIEPTTEDYLRAVVSAWDDWTRDDAAITWEAQMTRVINAARLHLNPTLPDTADRDHSLTPRCLP